MKRQLTVVQPSDGSERYRALEAIPSFWRGRATGRVMLTDPMDLSHDILLDHAKVAEYERRESECK